MNDPSRLHGTVLTLAALVEYQSGTIVSRTILKQPAGTVTLFAFAGGQELSEHTVPHDALVQVLDGEGTITIAGVAHRLKAGEMIIMPAHQPHAVKATRRFKMMLTMIRV